ncbi:hypothetical protein GIB67_032350 [Kingdonia uniflora]|uniref:Uncharacterized protein n=1 Tax=Kingdonia uniflora TaxID=39325 RepID=A0A7J7MJ38_9MAGN|nr:hypothetical protein GIB67_032350 [Kingdonia uniflora]
MNIFAKKPTAKEALQASKREMAKATRGIEKEIGALQLEEKKLIAETKKTAKTGNEVATRILARQLVRLRQQIGNLQSSRAQMRGIATHTQAMHAQTSVASGMKGASKAMASMNKQMDPVKQAKVMQDFQRQSAQLDMTTEMMSDAIDDVLDDDEAENETEDLTSQMVGNNNKKTASKQPTQGDRLRDLEEKVENFMVTTKKSLGDFGKQTSHTLNSILRAITSSASNGQRGFGAGVTESVTSSRGRGIPVGGFMRDARVVGDFTTNVGSVGQAEDLLTPQIWGPNSMKMEPYLR